MFYPCILPILLHSFQGILLGDILSTAFFCAESGNVGPRTSVVVVGCGPVGLLAVLACKQLGAPKVKNSLFMTMNAEMHAAMYQASYCMPGEHSRSQP